MFPKNRIFDILNKLRRLIKLELIAYLIISFIIILFGSVILLWLSNIFLKSLLDTSFETSVLVIGFPVLLFLIFFGKTIFLKLFKKSSLTDIATSIEKRIDLSGQLLSCADFIESNHSNHKHLENRFFEHTYKKLRHLQIKKMFTLKDRNKLILTLSILIFIFSINSLLFSDSPLQFIANSLKHDKLQNNVSNADKIDFNLDYKTNILFRDHFELKVFSNADSISILINDNTPKNRKTNLTKTNFNKETSKFKFTWFYVDSDFSFRLLLKKNETKMITKAYSVKVYKKPEILNITSTVIPPTLYSQSVITRNESGNVQGFKNSLAVLDISFNHNIAEGHLIYLNDKAGYVDKNFVERKLIPPGSSENLYNKLLSSLDGIISSYETSNNLSSINNKYSYKVSKKKYIDLFVSNKSDKRFSLILNNTKGRAILPIVENGFFKIKVKDTNGNMNDDRIYHISMLEDNHPVITILKPGKDINVKKEKSLKLSIEGSDDYQIKHMNLVIKQRDINNRLISKPKYRNLSIDDKKHSFNNILLDLKLLYPGSGGIIEYYAEIIDNARQKSTSNTYHISFPVKKDPLVEIKTVINKTVSSFQNIKTDVDKLEEQKQKLKSITDSDKNVNKEKVEDLKNITKKKDMIVSKLKGNLKKLEKLKKILNDAEKLDEETKNTLKQKISQNQELLKDLLKNEVEEYKKLMELLKQIKSGKYSKDIFSKVPLRGKDTNIRIQKLIEELKKRLAKIQNLAEIKELFEKMKLKQAKINSKIEQNDFKLSKRMRQIDILLSKAKKKLSSSSLSKLESDVNIIKSLIKNQIKPLNKQLQENLHLKNQKKSLQSGLELHEHYENIEKLLLSLIRKSNGEELREIKRFLNNLTYEMISLSKSEISKTSSEGTKKNIQQASTDKITAFIEEINYSKDFLKTRTSELNLKLEGYVKGKKELVHSFNDIISYLDVLKNAFNDRNTQLIQSQQKMVSNNINNVALKLITLRKNFEENSLKIPMLSSGQGQSEGRAQKLSQKMKQLIKKMSSISKEIESVLKKTKSGKEKARGKGITSKLIKKIEKFEKQFQNIKKEAQRLNAPDSITNRLAKLLQEIENLKFNLNKKNRLKNPDELLKKQQEIPKKLLKSVEEVDSWIKSKEIRKKEKKRKSEAQIKELMVDKKARNIEKKVDKYLKHKTQNTAEELTNKQKELAKDYVDSILKYDKK